MRWEQKIPEYGDMIRVEMGIFHHYGIYEDGDHVIQFGMNHLVSAEQSPAEPAVCVTDIGKFANGCVPEVAVFEVGEDRYDPQKTVFLAKSRMGETGYHILHNNCEHFARECITGNRMSTQVEDVRKMFRNMMVTDLYVASVPKGDMGIVVPALRQAQLESTNHSGLRRQRYYAWKLLEYALNHSFGLKMEDMAFSKSESGKWSCKECCFSLSHSKDAVAVAVSRKPVGVDIEERARPVTQRLGEKILTERERRELEALPPSCHDGYLLEKWSAKESIFKASNEERFAPRELETEKNVITKHLKLGEKAYLCTVCSEDIACLRVYENVDLTGR